MRVVLDTNVIIAAFATRGICTDIFELCLASHKLITSDFILSEVKRNLVKKVRLPAGTADEIISYLKEISTITDPAPVEENACRDKDDLKVIGTGVAGNASFIITGDADLLDIKEYGPIKIISPRQFWDFLKG